uniref:PX domain-containing protein n=2 Tax=Lotharella globosa TaxID=91324 RepID=A0A7S3YZW4_9EUKA
MRLKTERVLGLEWFINSVLYHPYLARNTVFKHFLTDTGDFAARCVTEDANMKSFDPVLIINQRYLQDYKIKCLEGYTPPPQTDIRAADDKVTIVKLVAFAKEYEKALRNFLTLGQQQIGKVANTLDSLESVIYVLGSVKNIEAKVGTKPKNYKKFDVGTVLTKWKAILETRPEAYNEIMGCFHMDLQEIEGLLDAIAFRKSLANMFKKAYKNVDRWKTKPAKGPSNEAKQKADQDRLKQLTKALDVCDKLLLHFHIANFFEDSYRRFEVLVHSFAKDQLQVAQEEVRFWHTVQSDLATLQ